MKEEVLLLLQVIQENLNELSVITLGIYFIFAIITAKAIDKKNKKERDAQNKLLNDVLDFAFPDKKEE